MFVNCIKNINVMQIRSFDLLKKYIKADLYRYATNVSLFSFMRFWFSPGFRFTFWLRLTQFHARNFRGVFFWFSFFVLRHYQFKYGIAINYTTNIGPGLYIGHFGGIVVNPHCIIGRNVNLSSGILLGQGYDKRSNKIAYPIIGDRVFLANNAKVIGNVIVGNGAVVGINSVLLQNIKDNAIAVGIPAEVVSFKGSSDYVGSYIDV